jgi:outer membrane protein OmpA-like peptidoglycan-associated protein
MDQGNHMNNKMRNFWLAALIFVATGPLLAQSRLQRANHAMQDLDYMSAIVLYLQTLEHDEQPEAVFNLAECYRKINDTENAELWYARAVALPSAKAQHRLLYGMMLQANGKCTEAKHWFEQYLLENPDDARGQFLLKACDQEQLLLQKGKDIYTVHNLPFNSNLDDFSPLVLGDALIFASDRDRGTIIKRTSLWTGNPFSELYRVDFSPGDKKNPAEFRYERPVKYSSTLNTRFHEASVAVSPDKQTIYFTRNSFADGKTGRSDDGLVKLKVFEARWDAADGDWDAVRSLPFNNDEYHSAHPCLSPDGQMLYFSSNRPGGYGGMDIYASARAQSGNWGPPQNLGPVVNTEGNEIFPFFAANNRLYFASNGHIGLGGLDIFYSTPQGDIENWSMPVNLGAPVNSTRDDFGICFGGDQSWGFFTSDRQGSVGRDDIYGFTKNAVPVEIYVYDAQTLKPIAGATLTQPQLGLAMTTGTDGKAAFDMRPGDCADFDFEKRQYESARHKGCTTNASPDVITRFDVALQKQANYALQGIVFDMTDGLPAAGVQMNLLNDCGKPSKTITTGPDGRYKFKLERNCCYTVQAEQRGFISAVSEAYCTQNLAEKTNLRANLSLQPFRDGEGFIVGRPEPGKAAPAGGKPRYNDISGLYENADGSLANFFLADGMEVREGVLIADGVANNPEKVAWKRGSEGFLINLYYDFNVVDFRPESLQELEKLRQTLLANPSLQVEIASHTDARGTADYNLELSQRRADAVVQWLSTQGIGRERLIGRGYGETKPVNHCDDAQPCSEEEYQLNRRTEFRILGYNAGGKPAQGSPAPKKPCEGCPF